jgi:hypothetical protein
MQIEGERVGPPSAGPTLLSRPQTPKKISLSPVLFFLAASSLQLKVIQLREEAAVSRPVFVAK